MIYPLPLLPFYYRCRQLLAGAADIVSLTLQFVDTVNDDTWSELLCDNQMDRLEVVVFDQCHRSAALLSFYYAQEEFHLFHKS